MYVTMKRVCTQIQLLLFFYHFWTLRLKECALKALFSWPHSTVSYVTCSHVNYKLELEFPMTLY